MVSNIIIAVLIVLFALIGMKRGIAITILNIAGIIVTAVSAYYLADMLSEFIYNTFVKQTVTDNIQQLITQSGVQYAAENCLDTLPSWVYGIVSFITGLFGAGTGGFQNNISASQFTSSNTVHLIESAVKSAVTSVFNIILFILLVVLIYILVKIIIKKVAVLFKIPVISQINKLLGGILGLIEGIVFVFIVVNIFYVFMNSSYPAILNNSLVSGNIFKIFCLFC